MLNEVLNLTKKHIEQIPKSQRKKYGQFFTSKETATYMASLFNIPAKKKELSILDPGAGSGILSIALLERLQDVDVLDEVLLVCYENDPNVIPLLEENLKQAQKQFKKKLTFTIITDNYILHQEKYYNLKEVSRQNCFDLIISNPPYMKISKNAPEALAMQDVCYGAPNLYFLFVIMGLFNLKEKGQMVYIIPRSWTSGFYFKKFRQKFLANAILENIHLFVSRDKVFETESVLQETIIIKATKTKQKPKDIVITTTQSNADFSTKTSFKVPYSIVVNQENSYVYLVTNTYETKILNILNKWQDTLVSIGLKMKTGLTVDFRHQEFLRQEPEKGSVPLFYSQHLQQGKVIFPIGKKNEYLLTAKPGLLQQNKNYLFVKRFTAKEEHRRLQCAVYLARKYATYKEISTQNKINFIDGLQNFSECVVYGLYVLFNSTFYDCYYRILNGSTQVNSTEINSMPMPNINMIESMGKKLILARDMSEKTCDAILKEYMYE